MLKPFVYKTEQKHLMPLVETLGAQRNPAIEWDVSKRAMWPY